ncbi:hypothetical protein C2857_003973 [Epichloe festucae Fl1]|uniref:Velvet domain-containing protein n=1 Tax=Epichloe festucae (strain Fl1) TaxID=877507 RepID=A0A7S9KV81_EPIFF|nr:hypothetical protein C2857_003973 [Epichloe festucae Fl1]
MASAVPVPVPVPANASRDSVQRIHRITRENRSLWYQLTVLQQPERARACGSGMKANSDRRPVDPPPVVELRIIEGPTVEEGKDITFDYNANFFLYASLEQARTLAHGRVQSAAATNPPILTGVPASGMAYLDRPAEAGYFIFPDLSVRHEGYFRLSFSLFETTKEEKDFDMEPTNLDLPPGVDWRMEIKTQPFNVFSAKKFPGLMESTQLSKTVADQGCRVRIRRDVRMRKRDGKGAAYERREDEYRRRTVTPAPEDPNSIRARSLSNSSEHRMAYGTELERRPSGVDAYHAAPQPPPPGYDAALPTRGGHLAFGEHLVHQYATPRQYAPPPPTVMQHMAPSAPYPSTLSSPYAKPDQGNYGYYPYHGRSSSSTCPSLAQSVRPESQYERPHAGYVTPSPSPSPTTIQQLSRHDPPQQHDYSHPPQKPQQKKKKMLPPSTTASSSLAPLKIAYLVSPNPLPAIEPQTQLKVAIPALITGDKRKRDDVFPQTLRSLHNGQRHLDVHFDRMRGMTPEPDTGTYSRADGQIGIVQFNEYLP